MTETATPTGILVSDVLGTPSGPGGLGGPGGPGGLPPSGGGTTDPLSYLLVAGFLGFGLGLIVYVALRRNTYGPALRPAGATASAGAFTTSGGPFSSSTFPEQVPAPRFRPRR